MAAQINPKSRGRFILNNHILLESIITELPELSDIISLSCVSNQINYHIRHIFPLEVRKLSLTTIPATTDARLLAVFNRHLQDEKGFKQRKSILDGGGTITVGGGGTLGAPYSGSFRNLSDVDLSGTLISTFTVKVLIAATTGGKVPGLTVPPSQAFYKDFMRVVPLTPEEARHSHDLRLLKEQGLRLTRLSVKNCQNVNVSKLIFFLRRVLAAATQEAKIQRNQATANNNNNGNNAGGGNHHIPEPLQHLGLLEEDITATPGPLPGTVDELAEYGLPCFSLRTLEVAGVDGLQFSKKDEFILFRNLASLNTIAGCLGLEIDVKFCQGAGCALGVLEDPDSSDYCIGDGEHHRDSYKRPLPYLPGERFLVDPASGRIFRIPKHCLPQAPGTQQQQQQQQQPPQPPQPPQNQPPPPPPPPPANPPQPNTHGFPQHILHIMQQHHHQLQQNHQYQVALQQNQQYHHLMNQVPPPAAPPPPPPPPAAIIPQQPGIAMMRRVRMEPDSSERQGRQVRRVAMLNGPRGLCEGCGRELWLCETCNTFWVLYCGGCAARNPTGAREHQQRRDEDDVDVV